MNRTEAASLLTLAAAYDQRTIGEADALAWFEILGDLRVQDAQQAIKEHYKREARRVMPVDVIDGVKRIRKDRLDRNRLPEPPSELTVPEYIAWQREMTRQIADGELTTTASGAEISLDGQERLRQIVAGVGREVPTA